MVCETLGVHILHAGDQLNGDQENCLESEGIVTQVWAGWAPAAPASWPCTSRMAQSSTPGDALCSAELLIEVVL